MEREFFKLIDEEERDELFQDFMDEYEKKTKESWVPKGAGSRVIADGPDMVAEVAGRFDGGPDWHARALARCRQHPSPYHPNSVDVGDVGQLWPDLDRCWADLFNLGTKSADLG